MSFLPSRSSGCCPGVLATDRASTVHCVVLCVALLAGAPLQAGEHRWHPLGPGGGSVAALLLDPSAPGVLYAANAAFNGGVYRSTDGGVSWVWRAQGIGNATVGFDDSIIDFAADASHPGTIYALSFSTLYRSTNDGASWSPLFQAVDALGGALAVIPGEPPTILLGDFCDVIRSADGGVTWSTIYSSDVGGCLVTRVVADLAHPGEVFVGTADNGVWKADGMGGARLLLEAGTNDLVRALSDPRTLYNVDGGSGWSSRDGGQTWTEFSRPNEVSSGGFCVAVSPAAPATVYLCDFNGGVSVSYDAGATWRQLSKGFPTGLAAEDLPQFASAVVIEPRATGTVWAAVSQYGVLGSADGGRSWSVPEQTGLTASKVDFLTTDTRRPESLYARFEPRLDVVSSVDGGLDWSVLAGAPPESTVVLNPVEPGTLYAVNGTGLFRDVGDGNWSPLLGGVVYDAAFPLPGVIVAGDCWLSRSVDGGRSWRKTLACHRFHDDQTLLALHFTTDPTDPRTLYAQITRGAAYAFFETWRSDDAGATWQLIFAESPALAVDPTHHGTLWAALGGSVSKTIDSGRHWTVVGEIPGVDGISSLVSSPTAPVVLYAGTAVTTEVEAGVPSTRASPGTSRSTGLASTPAIPIVFTPFPQRAGFSSSSTATRASQQTDSRLTSGLKLASPEASKLMGSSAIS